MGLTILQIGKIAFEIYYWLMIVYIFSSWFPQVQSTKIMIFIQNLVEPYLSFFRRFIPPLGMIDLSPIAAIFAYQFIGAFALSGLREIVEYFGLI